MNPPYPRKDNEFIAWYPLGLLPSCPSPWQKKRAGYYVHIPFCTAICDYCGFSVAKLKGASVSDYLSCLTTEIRRYADSGRLTNHRFVCGHFGGGTPSAIDAHDLVAIKRLIGDSFDVADDAEITVEVNPITFTLQKAVAYQDAGVNRISFGVQSFNDRVLATIGRPHRSNDVRKTLDVIHQTGWTNYSLDLMYGIPGQSIDDLTADLRQAIDTGATHISCFRLEIIPLTVLKMRESAFQLPQRLDTDLLNDMDDLVVKELTAHGYMGYGAFNFAKPGFESVHNAVAFMAPQDDYVGFGNSSYSFINNHVYCNHADIETYQTAVDEGKDPIALTTRVNALELMSRFFVLGLKFFRVSRTRFAERFGLAPEVVFGEVLTRLTRDGLLSVEGDDYVLSHTGRRYVNNVAKEFYVGKSRGMNQYPQFVSNLTVEQIAMFAELRERALASPRGGASR